TLGLSLWLGLCLCRPDRHAEGHMLAVTHWRLIKMSSAAINHSPRIASITPPRRQIIAATNAAPQAIRIANIATGPQRSGVDSGSAPHLGQTRSVTSYPVPQRKQTGIKTRLTSKR